MKVFKQMSYDPSSSVIGVNNGIYQLEFEEKDLKRNSNYKEIEETLMTFSFDKQDLIAELQIQYLDCILLKKAKITDFMVFTPHFLGYKYLISQVVVNCIEEVVAKKEYHLRKVKISDVKLNYYLLFVPMISTNEIDFSQSRIFLEKDYLQKKKSYFKISSYAEYTNLLDESPLVSFDKIGLPLEFQQRDILSIQGLPDLYFSNRLIKQLFSKNVTNFRIPNRQIELVFQG